MTETRPADLRTVIAAMVATRGEEKTICPSEVARAIAGSDERRWRLLMKPIRDAAVAMAREGLLTIRRKGRIADPEDFKGVYRLGAAAPMEVAASTAGEDGAEGAGKSASVRPVSQ
ncbi:MAG: DUF3253 domain-containing protein [Rhizobiaceae bacterium]|nr:DUF3253 domain-containing protein [Rhizobiaceae bacterium]